MTEDKNQIEQQVETFTDELFDEALDRDEGRLVPCIFTCSRAAS